MSAEALDKALHSAGFTVSDLQEALQSATADQGTITNRQTMTAQWEVRQAFWNAHHFVRHHGWRQNDYPTDVRVAFVDFVDQLARSGEISESLASRVTL